MKKTISELVKKQAWPELAKYVNIDPTLTLIQRSTYPTWKIPLSFEGRITLIGSAPQFRLLEIQSSDAKEISFLIKRVAKNTSTQIIWILNSSTPEFAYYNSEQKKIQRMRCDHLDRKEIQFYENLDSTIKSIFDSSIVTQAFFDAFQKSRSQLSNAIQNGPSNVDTRENMALIWLLRIVFLYFAQLRGALDQDEQYLSKKVHTLTKNKNIAAFHHHFLNILFFQLLNTPIEERTENAKKLGHIPFLNGGLFEPTQDESDHPNIFVANAVWLDIFNHLFEKFHFAIEEKGNQDCHAIDPEMLGKVFEALMTSGDRKRTGAFYTPRKIIRRMVSNGIYTFLENKTGIRRDILEGDLSKHPQRRSIISHLNTLRILDPAAGTGGFLIEALHLIEDLRQRLNLPYDGSTIQSLIQRHLFGVDKNPTAIRLCELRFWLQILLAYQGPISKLPPLPNLSHRFISGDALLDPFDTISSSALRKKWKYIEKLAYDFSHAHGKEKHTIRSKLNTEIQRLQRSEIKDRIRKLECDKDKISILTKNRNIFSEKIKLDAQQFTHLQNLEKEIETLKRLKARIHSNERGALFSFHSHFPRIMRDGGFDLILMNPPWVRSHHIPRSERELFITRYKSSRNQLWEKASEQNVRSRYGNQVDLSSIFLERSSELIKEDGRVIALVPSKTLRGISSAPLRGILGNHAIQNVEELQSEGESLFDATTYPAIIEFQKVGMQAQKNISALSPDKLLLFTNDFRAPWSSAPTEILKIMRSRSNVLQSLGSYESLRPRRGIYTGANEVFITNKTLIPNSLHPYLKSVIEGKGRDRKLLYLYDHHGKIKTELDTESKAYFLRHEKKLLSRKDHRPNLPLWQIFRLHPDLLGPKIIWKDISRRFDPTLDLSENIPLSSIYLIAHRDPKLSQRLLDYFNSDFVQLFVHLLAERVRGGYRRHFAWVIQCIPIPKEIFTSTAATWSSKKIEKILALLPDEIQHIQAYLNNENR